MRSAANGRSNSRQSCIGAMRSTKYWGENCPHTATMFSMGNADGSSFTAESILLASFSRGARSKHTRRLEFTVVQDGVDNLCV